MTNLDWAALAPLKNAIGWTVVHSIWQLTLVALVLYLLLRFIPQQKAEIRYRFLLLGLGIGLTWVSITFAREWQQEPVLSHSEPYIHTVLIPQTANDFSPPQLTPSLWEQISSFPRQLDAHMPAITLAWLIGIFLFSQYLLFGLGYLKYLEYSSTPLPSDAWQLRLNVLAQQMGVKRQVRLLISRKVEEPITFQLFRPVIMVPIFFFTGLTPAQMEVLLLHELAHIRRYDFTINLLQSLVEILFFFHPAVWWLSGKIREEREYCCDNAVVAVRENPFPYVEALTRIQSTQFSHKNRLAMSAKGNRSMLSKRVFRLLGRYEREPSRFRSVIFAILLLMVSFSAQAFFPQKTGEIELASLPILENTENTVSPEWHEINVLPSIEAPQTEPESEPEPEPTERPGSEPSPAFLNPPVVPDTLPLFVVDGKIKETDYQLSGLKPDDIKEITVLKGAKSIEKYGQAGQYGVVEITTKQLDQNENDSLNSESEAPASNTNVNIRAKSESGHTTVRGKVFDEDDQPLIGANILIKGTSTGTITDFTGEFVLQLPDDCATLIFAYIGKKTVELENVCAGEEPLDVKLKSAEEVPTKKTGRVVEKPELNGPVINGRIVNEQQQPMVGANILIKGMTIGTVSDLQGNFRLQLPSSDCATLVISYIGMKKKFVENVCEDFNLAVILEEEVVDTSSPMVKPDPEIATDGKGGFSDFNVFPNPAKGAVNVSFQLEESAQVKLSAYTTDGKLIKTITNQTLNAGAQQFLWSAGDENRGTFIILLEIEGKGLSRRQIVIE